MHLAHWAPTACTRASTWGPGSWEKVGGHSGSCMDAWGCCLLCAQGGLSSGGAGLAQSGSRWLEVGRWGSRWPSSCRKLAEGRAG